MVEQNSSTVSVSLAQDITTTRAVVDDAPRSCAPDTDCVSVDLVDTPPTISIIRPTPPIIQSAAENVGAGREIGERVRIQDEEEEEGARIVSERRQATVPDDAVRQSSRAEDGTAQNPPGGRPSERESRPAEQPADPEVERADVQPNQQGNGGRSLVMSPVGSPGHDTQPSSPVLPIGAEHGQDLTVPLEGAVETPSPVDQQTRGELQAGLVGPEVQDLLDDNGRFFFKPNTAKIEPLVGPSEVFSVSLADASRPSSEETIIAAANPLPPSHSSDGDNDEFDADGRSFSITPIIATVNKDDTKDVFEIVRVDDVASASDRLTSQAANGELFGEPTIRGINPIDVGAVFDLTAVDERTEGPIDMNPHADVRQQRQIGVGGALDFASDGVPVDTSVNSPTSIDIEPAFFHAPTVSDLEPIGADEAFEFTVTDLVQ